jgi:hypothetical protein
MVSGVPKGLCLDVVRLRYARERILTCLVSGR